MSISSILDHPPDTSSAPVTLASANDALFIRRTTSDLLQCCIHRAAIDPVRQCVLWEDEIPSEIVTALRLSPDSCHALGIIDALQQMTDLEERRRILSLMLQDSAPLQ
ncbi:MAG: hypothetical protein PHS73_00755 [Candidatus Peribacteraceae bacterium]|nr:hypothetical protein [Candidatus Peribacteraceae bacterium]